MDAVERPQSSRGEIRGRDDVSFLYSRSPDDHQCFLAVSPPPVLFLPVVLCAHTNADVQWLGLDRALASVHAAIGEGGKESTSLDGERARRD